VPLPFPAERLVGEIDAVLVTHLHRDHFDEAAERLLPRDIPVFCQPADAKRLGELGFDARPNGSDVRSLPPNATPRW
jgi:L-ascorbate metabolism protein UlaG (beta-lactamase superfamily)